MLVLAAAVVLGAADESLAGSNFEIDTDANLVVDNAAPSIDWVGVAEARRVDAPSGSGDDSFGMGSKEDTAVPAVVSGSIPPNKSDLKQFGVYKEDTASGKFLHLFWSRVQDPSGTTNMDFEFNQSSTISANGVTPIRTDGDLLITYDLSKGGTVPVLSLRTWDGGAGEWGPASDLSASGDASGSINTSPIAVTDSDGLGSLDPRTFGEASIDLDIVFDPTSCTSFGSAYLKSRSSDSFTAALKDFIAPQPVNISNCGTVIIRKETVPGGDTGSDFGFTSNLVADPADATAASFSLKDGGSKTISHVIAGTGYNVTETDPATLSYALTDIDCSASSTGASYTEDENNRKVTFDVSVGDTIDCTFTNTAYPKLTLIKNVTNDSGGTAVATDWTLSASGTGGFSNASLSAIAAGSYDSRASTGPKSVDAGVQYTLSESATPDYYSASNWSCSGGGTYASPDKITLALGDDVTCQITNNDIPPKLTLIKNVNNDYGLNAVATDWTLSASGTGGFSNASLSAIAAGSYDSRASSGQKSVNAGVQYTLSESTSPSGYSASNWSCSGGGTYGSPDKITLALGDDVTCQITNSDSINSPSGSTTMGWVLHDSANFNIRAGAGDAASAKITFRLYSNDECSVQVGSDEEVTVTLSSGGAIAGAQTSTGFTISSPGTFYWRAFYSGDSYNSPANTACGSEVTTITDNSP